MAQIMNIEITGGNKTQYGHSIQKMDHNIQETGLFSDGNLIRALDNHPPEDLDICTRGSFQVCARGQASSHDLLDAVKRGALWLNLRSLERVQSPHGRLVNQMHKSFNSHMGINASSRIGGLLISSPTATVGYHIDLTDVTLWHLRGKKRLFVYPNREPFIQPKNVQDIAMASGVERIPYDPAFEQHVITIDLEPGEVICWPHLSPHRVDNLDGLNVSLSLESMTMQSRMRVGAHLFDGYMNKLLGTKLGSHQQKPALAFAKTGTAVALKKIGLSRRHVNALKPRFKINMAMPDCIEPI